jgi:hypothetical protein
MDGRQPNDFELAAQHEHGGHLVGEIWEFLWSSKKWWLAPVVAVLLAMSVLMLLSASAAAPFIYTFF